MKQRFQKIGTVFAVVNIMLFVLSVSIAVPLLWRGFYYLHIDGMLLPERTGYSKAEIHEAFDEMMDYCVYGEPFGTGVLRWSQSGYQHFQDCAKLFRLDFTVAIITTLILVVLAVLYHRGARPAYFCGRGPLFWGGCLLSGGFILIAILAALNFKQAFVLFHGLAFPGKSNWLFNPKLDQIILILPQEYFRNCAILIVGVLLVACIALMLIDIFCLKPNKKEALACGTK